PVLTVSGTHAQGVVLETLVMSDHNHDSAVASAAARMSVAAGGRPLVEMGSRRTHEQAAIAAARAAYLAGFTSTSNLAAGRRYGIPTVGTAAHAFTMAYATEQAAFASQVATHGTGTTLLVDTYDIEQGIRNAIEVAGTGLAAVRIDSGDLDKEARKARALLDSLGASQTRILATSDLDEFVIAALGNAPVDSFGVGTRVVTGSGHATAEFVYKLVEIDGRPVAKASEGKVSHGGRKHASRELADGAATREVLSTKGNGPGRPLQVRVVRDGSVVHRPSLEEIRTHHLAARSELSGEALAMSDGPPALEGVLS
ncbi:MAG: nicotinate phosphoribosyltransferase, partial [Frankiales bacterium]|nr:nicotinate phosphoribosyltransferase [Frankiales bacterium]